MNFNFKRIKLGLDSVTQITDNVEINRQYINFLYRPDGDKYRDSEKEFDKIEPNFTIELSIPVCPSVTLNDCFEETFNLEIMNDPWLDDKTNTYKKINKQTYLCYLPEILVIHLKRWNANLNKNNTLVKFDETLNIFKYTLYKTQNECSYELFGIINHQGSVMGGHYFSYIKKIHWYSFDDSTITKIEPSAIINSKNYCLFYRKIK